MYLLFAWRYFKAKKSTHAINIISWITTAVIAFSTMCQVLVLSVFNGFEDLVKSLYANFYTDLKIIPTTGKTFILTSEQIKAIRDVQGIIQLSLVAEEKALLQNGELQTVVSLKGVDRNYIQITGVSSRIIRGKFDIGNITTPYLILGVGIENALGSEADKTLMPLTVFLPKRGAIGSDPESSISEGNAFTTGTFAIQQDFDNKYAITNIDFVKQQMHYHPDEYTGVEIKINDPKNLYTIQKKLQKNLGNKYTVLSRYQENYTLYSSMELEKWAVFSILTLILIIASFNMISALTMLVLEKEKDISILKSMGASNNLILKIFLFEGLILAFIGSIIGISMALVISLLQIKFKFIKLEGNSFLIDYFPVKFQMSDFLFVIFTAFLISFIASYFPSKKASRRSFGIHN